MPETLPYYSSRPFVIFEGMSHDHPLNELPMRPEECIWCSAKLTSTDFRDGVCFRCYQLLSNAGLNDDTIFQQSESRGTDPSCETANLPISRTE
jgi:hypothetical protein